MIVIVITNSKKEALNIEARLSFDISIDYLYSTNGELHLNII